MGMRITAETKARRLSGLDVQIRGKQNVLKRAEGAKDKLDELLLDRQWLASAPVADPENWTQDDEDRAGEIGGFLPEPEDEPEDEADAPDEDA